MTLGQEIRPRIPSTPRLRSGSNLSGCGAAISVAMLVGFVVLLIALLSGGSADQEPTEVPPVLKTLGAIFLFLVRAGAVVFLCVATLFGLCVATFTVAEAEKEGAAAQQRRKRRFAAMLLIGSLSIGISGTYAIAGGPYGGRILLAAVLLATILGILSIRSKAVQK